MILEQSNPKMGPGLTLHLQGRKISRRLDVQLALKSDVILDGLMHFSWAFERDVWLQLPLPIRDGSVGLRHAKQNFTHSFVPRASRPALGSKLLACR